MSLKYVVYCDECQFGSGVLTDEQMVEWLAGGPDGKWYAGKRHVCECCRIDRACRIFGHTSPKPFVCYRCGEAAA